MNANKYDGMTVNERLFAAGLLDQFDDAARQRDRHALLAILARVEMTPNQAQQTVDTVLANERRPPSGET